MRTAKELLKEIENIEKSLEKEINGQTRMLLIARLHALIWVLNK